MMTPAKGAGTAPDTDRNVEKDRLFVTSLARGLHVLRCFSSANPELRTTDIAKMTGLAQPTVWRLCHTLRRLGYLGEAPGDRLRLGNAVLALGYAGIGTASLGEMALPYVRQLAAETEGAVSLGAREGESVVYLQRHHGRAIVFSEFRIGGRVPLALSPTGWAIMAGLTPSERKALVADLQPGEQSVSPDLSTLIETAMERYRETGYVESVGVMHPQLNAVSVPLVDVHGNIPAAITCGGIDTAFPPQRLPALARRLKEVADLLSLTL